MTLQDLKNRKSYIIAKISSLGCSEQTKSFMSVMMTEIEFGFEGTVYDLVMSVYNTNFRTRSRKVSKIAEAIGNGIKADGREVNYQITKYL